MIRRVGGAVRLFLAVQRSAGFINVYIGLSAVTILFTRFFLPPAWWPIVVPAVLLGEYGTMGVFMVGGLHFLALNERSTEALSVTPLRLGERIVAMVLAPALVATLSGTVVFGGVLGMDARLLLLIAPLLGTALLAGATGLVVSSRYVEFTTFLISAIPVVTLFSLPMLPYFELVPRYSFAWLPWDAALFSFQNLTRPSPDLVTYAMLLIQIFLFAVGGIWWATRLHARAMV